VNDDALSPVVAMMLILTVVVTLFSLWNTTYLPGLKQQAEVEHLKQVEEGMVRIDSAIKDAIYYRHDGALSVPVPLGGGDIMFNNLRSGGELRVSRDDEAVMTLTLNPGNVIFEGFLSNITYMPVSNFWIDQGYTLQNGSMSITKGGLKTPRDIDYQEDESSFADSLFHCVNDGDLTKSIENITPATRSVTSGNGIARTVLNATNQKQIKNDVDSIGINFRGLMATEMSVDEYEEINSSLKSLGDSTWDSASNQSFIKYTYSLPKVITVERLDIVLSAE